MQDDYSGQLASIRLKFAKTELQHIIELDEWISRFHGRNFELTEHNYKNLQACSEKGEYVQVHIIRSPTE